MDRIGVATRQEEEDLMMSLLIFAVYIWVSLSHIFLKGTIVLELTRSNGKFYGTQVKLYCNIPNLNQLLHNLYGNLLLIYNFCCLIFHC